MTSVRSKAKQQNRKGIQSPPPADVLASKVQRTWVLAAILAVATIALYYPVSHQPFVNYDDDAYVTENAHVQSGLTWDTVKWAFTTYYYVNWHPLTWISHALDYQLFQLDPGGHHDTNLVLHVLNALLLFWVLLRATGSPGPSFVVAAVFALHPNQRRIRGLDLGTQKPVEHLFFPTRTRLVHLVCAQTECCALRHSRGALRARPDGQAAGNYVSLRVVAVGLLAIAENGR